MRGPERLHELMADGMPLTGVRVVVTRSAGQAGELSERLRALGAEPVEVPVIAIVASEDGGAGLADAVANLDRYDRIAVASPNGARRLIAAHREHRPSGDRLPPVAAVGSSTAAAFVETPFAVDIVPNRSVAEELVEAIGAAPRAGARLLLVQAEVARPALADGLAAHGWSLDRVVAYRSIDGEVSADAAQAASAADIITFTSSSTVERFVRLAGRAAVPSAVASIGPITSATARGLGLRVTVEADPHNLDGLIDAVVAWRK